jgi:SAM-dependent methyltransferase
MGFQRSLAAILRSGIWIGLSIIAVMLGSCQAIAPTTVVQAGVYEYRTPHSSDGIGKFYMGRQIAEVMGHRGAMWLERPSRTTEERPDQVIPALGLTSDAVVADLGAGTGYFTFRLSAVVPDGKVLAVDVQPEMLDIIHFIQQEDQIDNVETILGSPQDPHLPANSVDLALMVDAYHEFAYPKEMMDSVVRALNPGGRVALVEYRGENPLIPIKGLHKMTQKQVRREMQAVGLEWQETQEFLPQQHLLIFRKPDPQ